MDVVLGPLGQGGLVGEPPGNFAGSLLRRLGMAFSQAKYNNLEASRRQKTFYDS